MKKLIALLAALWLVALPVSLTGCDDSDKEVGYNDGRLVTDVVIPTSMTVYRGMEVSVSGYGFAQGDAVALRAGEDFPATTTVVSEKLLTFAVPDAATDQTVYKIVLNRANDYQVLGSSKITVQLAVDVQIGKTVSGTWGGDAVIRGRGFAATDKLFLNQGGGTFEAAVKSADNASLTFTIPQNASDGDCEFTLQRGTEEQLLGSAKLVLSFSGVTVPDKEGATIKGIVHCAGQGVADVLVSDGDLITKTDANGFYWLNSEKRNALAFVILPAGYDVPTSKAMPQFWQPCTLDAKTVEQLDFQLLRTQNDAHTMLVATDMHLANRNSPLDYVQFADGFVKELTSTYNAAPGKVYCLNLGDFSWDGYWYSNKWAIPECKKTVEDFAFQMWSVMGNHDNDPYIASDFGAEGPYRQHMGPVYYAMNIGKVHYIMLDDTEYLNTGGAQGTVGSRNYNRRFDAKQLAWLKEELKHVDKSTPIVVGTHCPLYTYNAIGGTSISLQSQADLNNILSCFDGFQRVTFLTGHTHVNRNIQSPTYPNVYEQNIAAVCGSWWWTQQYGKNNVCTDGSPAGYKVFTVDGTDIKWQYKATGLPAEKQFMTYDMNKVKEYWTTDATALKAFAAGNDLANRDRDYASVGDNAVYINVWAYEPGWQVTVTENGTPLDVKQVWSRKDPLHTISYDIPRGAANNGEITFPSTSCMHMFEVTATSATTTLEVSVTDRFGNTYTETMTRPKALTTDVTK